MIDGSKGKRVRPLGETIVVIVASLAARAGRAADPVLRVIVLPEVRVLARRQRAAVVSELGRPTAPRMSPVAHARAGNLPWASKLLPRPRRSRRRLGKIAGPLEGKRQAPGEPMATAATCGDVAVVAGRDAVGGAGTNR
ncbi:MAG: hypothetical protein ABSB49_05080 [Polyangia bacterium]